MIKKITKSFVRQQDEKDCGVACLLSLIRYYGGNNNFEKLRLLSGASVTGTTLLGLYQAAQQLGFEAEGCEADMDTLLLHASPCILHVVLENNLQHYVVYYGKVKKNKEELIIVGDPGKGILFKKKGELEAIWQSKHCLTLTPGNQFETSVAIAHKQRSWFFGLLKEDYPLLLLAAVIGIVVAGLGLTMAVYSQRLIDDILPKRQYEKLYIGIVLVFLLLLAKEAIAVLRSFLLLRQSKSFNIRIIAQFYRRLLQLPKSFFDTRKIGDLTARLNDTSRIQRVITTVAGNILLDSTIIIVSFCFLFSYHWQVALLALVGLPVFFVLVYYHNRSITAGQRSVMGAYAQSEGNYISTLQGIDLIKNHRKEDLFTQANQAIYENYQNGIFKLAQIQMRLSFLANCFAAFLLCGVLLYLSTKVLAGRIKVGEMMAMIGMIGSMLPSVANLALIAIPFNEAKIAFERMYEFTAIKPLFLGTTALTEFDYLIINDISFRFPGRSPVLDNISFIVRKGEIVALMGENGCGKTTLVQILLQHYVPERGSIVINNNTELKNLDSAHWRDIVISVPQQIHIFNTTVLENIAFDDAKTKTQIVLDFLQQYGFDKFINQMPQSFLTLIGEEGINLSGGQKQIIALARALYHNPQLLILDEATASMDRETEQFVLKLLLMLKAQMAIIFITHRLHVLKSFSDRIYILENGTITAKGNHEELLKNDNLYSKYWNDLNVVHS